MLFMRRIEFGTAILSIFVSLTWAQAPGTGAIAGTVFDPSGALVTGAQLIARNRETNLTRTAISNSQGTFRVPLLPPGNYSLVVTAQGFTRKTIASVPVAVT